MDNGRDADIHLAQIMVAPEYIIEAIEDRGQICIMHEMNQFDHRSIVLGGVAELEFIFSRMMLAHFQKHSATVIETRADREIFEENRALGSLSKMLTIAPYLGLVTDDEHFDTKVMVRLRNMYAHGRDRKQFHNDPKAAEVLHSLRLFKNSRAVFAEKDHQTVFLECMKYIQNVMVERTVKINDLPPFPSVI